MKCKYIFTLVFWLVACNFVFSQSTTKITGKKNKKFKDSLKATDYNYVLPFLGDKIRAKGYEMPLPAGLMLGFYTAEQDIEMNELSIAFRDSEYADVSEFVSFSELRSSSTAYTFRPDVWLLPFMNVYAIFNKFSASTSLTLESPFYLEIPDAENDGSGVGFGSTLAYGYGRVWFTGNFNFAWSKTNNLIKPTKSFSTSLRVGTTLKTRSRKHVLSVWAGTNYIDYLGSNGGSYDLTKLIPDDNNLLDDLLENVNDALDGLNEKYEEFCSTPGNQPACKVLDPLLEEFKDRIEDKIDGIEKPEDLYVHYTFSSSPAQKWNMLVGAQYQFNKRWELRAEWGFVGTRKSFLFNVNYRFGIKKAEI